MFLRVLLAFSVVLAASTPVFAWKPKNQVQPQQQLPNKKYLKQIYGQKKVHGNNGLGNGIDPPPPGNPPMNDGPGTFPGNPGNKMRGRR